MRYRYLTLCIVIVISAATFLCPSSIFATDTVKFAVILARTGAARMSDASGWGSAQLAAEYINEHGGLLGKKLQLVMIDSRSTPIGATKAAKQAVEEKVVGVIGAGWSSQSLPIASVFQDAGIPMITPSSTHPDITRVGNYIFRVCFNDTFQGGVLAKFAYRDIEATTAVVFRNISETYSTFLSKSFEESFQSMGGKVLWYADYKTDTSDFTDLLEEVKKLAPDVVLMSGYERDSGIIIRQAGSQDVHALFLGGDGWGSGVKDIAGTAADGSFYLAQWHPDYPGEQSRRLVKTFKARFPDVDHTSIMVALTYEAVMLMADAIQRAGSAETTAIQKALSQTKNFEGITGTITFDEHGDPTTRTASILKFSKNNPNPEYLKSISYP